MRNLIFALLLACGARADLVIFENGDRLSGKVLTLTESELKLQNEVQGVITLPREKIASIHLRVSAAQPLPGVPTPSALPNIPSQDQDARAMMEQVQNQLLGGATPETQKMYQDMVSGFLSGKIQLDEIRAQAQSALNDLRAMEQELGDDETSALLGSYAAILENFLKASPPATNSTAGKIPPGTVPSAPAPAQE